MTIITLKADESSSGRLREFLEENEIQGKKDFHTTLFYSESFPFFERVETGDKLRRRLRFGIVLNPTYCYDLLGENRDVLVLGYKSEIIDDIRYMLSLEFLKQEDFSEEESNVLVDNYAARIEGNLVNDPILGPLQYRLKPRRSPIYFDSPNHITLAKTFGGSLESLPEFTEPISFSEFDWYPQQIRVP